MRYQPNRVLHVSNVLQPGLAPGPMLGVMFVLRVLSTAPLFLSACAVVHMPPTRTASAPVPFELARPPAPDTPPRAPSTSPPDASVPPALSRRSPVQVDPTPAPITASATVNAQASASPTPSLPIALAARFPDPAVRYNTPGLQAGRVSWSTADEIAAWLRELSAPAPAPPGPAPKTANRRRTTPVKVSLLDLSPGLQAVHLSTPPNANVEDTASGTVDPPPRPTVLLMGGRESSAANEAMLVVARELARGKLRPLLTRINVVVLPHTGLLGQADATEPDDHVQLNTARAKILARLAHAQQATVVLSATEGQAMATLGNKRALSLADVVVGHASSPNLPEFLTRAAGQWFQQPMLAALKAEGMRAEDSLLGTLSFDSALPGKVSSSQNVAYAAALKNRIGLEVLTAGSDLERDHVQRRVHAQVIAISSALASTAKRAAELAELLPYLDREVSAQACRQPFVLHPVQTAREQAAQLLDMNTGAEINAIPAGEPALPGPATSGPTRIKPCGYWLAADAGSAVERLRLHGVQVMRVTEPGSLLGDTYKKIEPPELPESSKVVNAVSLVRGVIDVPADSFYVPVDQAQGNLVVAVLEPDAPSRLTSQDLPDTSAGLTRIMTPPAVRLELLP